MKPIEELGVSPWPWKATQSGLVMKADVMPRDNEMVAVCCGCYEIDANARLIAAAPELYEALHRAVCDSCYAYCGENPELCNKEKPDCVVKTWRAALAKAGGKEAAE